MFKRKALDTTIRETSNSTTLANNNDSKPLESRTAPATATAIVAPPIQPQAPVAERTAAKPQADMPASAASCIGSGMSIVGNIECNGPAQVFGRIEGEVHASDLLIGDGARVEGSVIAQEVTVCGSVKGTVRAARVRLQKGGAVEGDIFHRSLSIDEDALFEGTSRRVENPVDVRRVENAVDARRVENPVDLASRGDAAEKKSEPKPTPPPSPTLPPATPLAIDAEQLAMDGDLRPH